MVEEVEGVGADEETASELENVAFFRREAIAALRASNSCRRCCSMSKRTASSNFGLTVVTNGVAEADNLEGLGGTMGLEPCGAGGF